MDSSGLSRYGMAMLRWIWWTFWLLLVTASIGSLCFAVYIELEIRYELDAWGWGLSYATYKNYIFGWKRWVAWLALGGAVGLSFCYPLRPWGRRRGDDAAGDQG